MNLNAEDYRFDNILIEMMDDLIENQQEQFTYPPLPQHQFKIEPSEIISSQALYVGFYGISSLFLSTLTETTKPIARVNFQKSKQKSLATIYKNQQNNSVFMIFHDEFEKMKEIHFANFVEKHFKFQEMFIISSKAKGLLEKHEGNNLRYIATSYAKRLHVQRWEEGLVGPQADLLRWGEENRVPVICFIGVFDEYQVKKETVAQIFNNVEGILNIKSQFDISKQIKQYNMQKYSNKLYL